MTEEIFPTAIEIDRAAEIGKDVTKLQDVAEELTERIEVAIADRLLDEAGDLVDAVGHITKAVAKLQKRRMTLLGVVLEEAAA